MLCSRGIGTRRRVRAPSPNIWRGSGNMFSHHQYISIPQRPGFKLRWQRTLYIHKQVWKMTIFIEHYFIIYLVDRCKLIPQHWQAGHWVNWIVLANSNAPLFYTVKNILFMYACWAESKETPTSFALDILHISLSNIIQLKGHQGMNGKMICYVPSFWYLINELSAIVEKKLRHLEY